MKTACDETEYLLKDPQLRRAVDEIEQGQGLVNFCDIDAAEKTARMSAIGIDPLLAVRDALHGEAIFNEDGVNYQRRVRDEWRI